LADSFIDNMGLVLCVGVCPFLHDSSALGVVLPLSMGVLIVSVRAADASEEEDPL
jgi:Na+-translocating ferredoxin:NAD+ oxidoreductase RnfA subunit